MISISCFTYIDRIDSKSASSPTPNLPNLPKQSKEPKCPTAGGAATPAPKSKGKGKGPAMPKAGKPGLWRAWSRLGLLWLGWTMLDQLAQKVYFKQSKRVFGYGVVPFTIFHPLSICFK